MKDECLNREQLEKRRLIAALRLLTDMEQSDIPGEFHVSRTTASRWASTLRKDGFEGMKRRKATGRPSRLSIEQKNRLAEICKTNPAHFGFSGDRWATGNLTEVIKKELGVRYSQDHIRRLFRKITGTYMRSVRPRAPKITLNNNTEPTSVGSEVHRI